MSNEATVNARGQTEAERFAEQLKANAPIPNPSPDNTPPSVEYEVKPTPHHELHGVANTLVDFMGSRLSPLTDADKFVVYHYLHEFVCNESARLKDAVDRSRMEAVKSLIAAPLMEKLHSMFTKPKEETKETE